MSSIEYRMYLSSDEWRIKSEAMKWLSEYRCQICNRHQSQVSLNTHHRTYVRVGKERPGDLTVLCERCHKLYEQARMDAQREEEKKLADEANKKKELEEKKAEVAARTPEEQLSCLKASWKKTLDKHAAIAARDEERKKIKQQVKEF